MTICLGVRILSSHGILIVRPLWVYLPALKWHQVPSSGHETKRHPGDRWDGEWRHPQHSKYLFEGELMRPDLKMVVNACNTMESVQFIVYMYIYIFIDNNECVVSLVLFLFLDW